MKHSRLLIQLIATVVVIIGFRLATQAGQGLGVVQNDGYAGSGGFLILIGGVVFGMTLTLKRGKK